MRSSPIQVGSGFYRSLALGNNSTMAIDPYGTLSAWGENLYGQAGTNNITSYSWTQLSNGDVHSLALRSDGTLYAWGLNTSGQLGVGNTVARQSPTQISGSWTQVSAGASHTIAINNDGVVYGWGLNTSGQVGDVTVISRSAPVQIPIPGPSTNYSNFFNGTTQYLRYNVNNNAAFNFGTNNFTIEAWVYPTVTSGTYVIINQSQTNASAGSTLFLGISANAATLQHASGATYTTNISGGTVTANTWTHIAGTRNGNTWTLWVNGISVGTNTDSTSVLQDSSHANAGGINIGVGFITSATTATSFFAGYISNARVVNGTALYTTGFYPSTGRFTTTSQNATAGQVSLLTAQSATIADNSSNIFAITNTGTVTVSGINPFGPYYSGSFTTTGQSLRIASNSAFDFGTGNFTIECWFYSTTVGTQVLIDRWNFGFSIFLLRLVGTSLQGFVNTTGGSSSIASTGPVTANTWNHAAFVRNGSIFTLYLNGASTGTPLNNALAMMTGTSVVSIGGNTSETIVGYMSDVRIVKGTAVYTGNFTPPGNILRTTQSAMTNIVALTGTETVLLTLQNATIIDNSVNAFTITNNGSVSITTSYAPFVGSATEYLIASKVAAGNNFTLAIRNDNTLYSWGLNTSYQLGNGTTTSRNNPGQVGTSSWSQISAGASHALAIDANNQLYGWGNSSSGQVGVKVFSWTQVAGSSGTGFAIRDDGSLWAWGLNSWGQLGQNDTISNKSSPVAIGTDSWLQVSSGEQYVLAIRSDNTLWSWGINNVGQLGLDSIASRSSPVQVGTSSWSSVSAGINSSLGIKTDTTLWAWGSNGTGQLGIGLTTSRSSPVQVSSAVTTWSVISISASIAAAISTSGGLYLWGLELANGTSVNRSSPVQLGTESWSAVATGLSSVIGIDTLGRLYSWGTNTNHQLGDNSALTVSRSSPVQLGASSWSIVSAGTSSSFAITTDSRLFAWGLNGSNQLGDGTAEPRSSPVQIGAGINFTKISGGGINGYAIDNNYYLYSWGNGSNGAIGDGTVVTKLIPTQVGGVNNNTIFIKPFKIGASSWSQISAGYSHSVALTSDNQLFTWGNNTNGQLGFNMSFISISAGNSTTSVIRSDGTLWTWGNNTQGQLGDNTSVISRSSPVQAGTLINWSKTTRTSLTSYAIDNTGKLYAWGENSTGAIGDGTVIARSSPVQIGTSSWIMVATGGTGTAGQQTAYAIRSDGGLFAWGASNYGERGVGGAAFPLSPIQIGSSSWSVVSGGNQFAMAITSDGKLYGWGRNDAGQLGIALSTSTFTWSKIVSSGTHTLALRSDNLLFAWGLNSSGQLGDGTTVNKSSPVQIASGSYTQISAGFNASYAIRSDGSLWSWGNNDVGQLGDPASSATGRSSPVQVGSSSWSTVSAGKSLAYVIATTNTTNLFAWGLNSIGQLGVGDYFNRSSPTQVSGGGSWTAISAGGGHSLAIKSDGKLYTWGLGTTGQTAQAGTTFSWTQVANGNLFSLAIRSDGLLFAWGLNTEGEMGDGSTVSKSSPVQIGASSWSQIAAGATHTLAVRVDGTLWAWGVNNAGQLGQSDVVWRSSPVQIGSSTNWSKVAASQSQSFAIDTTSSLYAWGLNTNGRLGVGNTLSRSSPVQVATPVVSWSQVAAGASFTGGIDVLGRLYTWGFNTQGQLGGAGAAATTGSTISRSSPSQVGASSWSFVAAGFNAMAGIASTGGLFTWGNNSLGELGDNNLVAVVRSSPVQVGTSSWTSVTASSMNSAGGGQMLAITTANALWGWGQNVWGSIGDGTNVTKSSMVAVTGGGTYVKASAGPASLAITTTTFSLQGWGNNNNYGAVGDNTLIPRSAPVQIGTSIPTILYAPAIIGDSSWTSVSAGGNHSTAIRTDSGLFAWGLNTSGQLGDSTTISRSSPVQVGTSSWTTVSAGTGHTMALRYLDGGLFTWGLGNPGQLGSGTTAARSSPVQVGTSSWTSINSGASTGVAIDITNNIYAWGLGTSGQIGDNTLATKTVPTKVGTLASTIEYSPIQVGSSSWSIVSAGGSHAIGLKIDNTVFAWGLNVHGQLGDSTVVSRSSPVQVGTVTNSLTNANAYSLSFNGTNQYLSIPTSTSFDFSGDFTIETWIFPTALTTNRIIVERWVSGNAGGWELYWRSTGTSITFYVNATVLLQDPSATNITLNTWAHVAVTRSGTTNRLFVNGVIVDTATDSTSLTSSLPLTIGRQISTNTNDFAGNISNFRVVKGTALYTSAFTPSAIPLTAITNTSLLTAQNTTIVDNSTNAFTITNNNSVSYSLNTPFTSAIAAGVLFATQISAGDSHTLTIDTSNKLYAWGYNGPFGVLGLTNTTNRSAPTQIGLATNWNNISAGTNHSMATDNTGALYLWGLNAAGQIGDNSIANRSSPAQITSISIPNTSSPTQVGTSSYSFVCTGNNTTAAISSDNKLFVWGLGTMGQLGTGVTFSRSSPVQISTNSYNLVNAGGTHTTFVTNYSPQLILSTGLNTSGQLGLSDIISRSSPTQVAASTSKFNSPVTVSVGDYSSYYVSSPTQVGTSSWTQVSAGGTHTLGVKYDNTLYAWGYNANGQLGGSNTINRSSPVQVGTSSWNQVSAGDSHNVIAKSDGTINTFGLNSFGQLGDGT